MSFTYYDIANQTEWNSMATTMNSMGTDVSNVVVRIVNDIVLNGSASVIKIKNGTFDGQLYRITRDTNGTTQTNGLFELSGGTIKNLYLDGGSNLTVIRANSGALIDGTGKWGNLHQIDVSNFKCPSVASSAVGGLSCTFGINDATKRSYITNCCVKMDISPGSDSAGLVGSVSVNLDMSNCYFKGSIIDSRLCGGLLGRVNSSSLTSTRIINITNCYADVSGIDNTSAYSSAGFVGICGSNQILNITKSYFKGRLGHRGSGFVGAVIASGLVTIEDSYLDADLGGVSGTRETSVFVGDTEGSGSASVTIKNTYQVGSFNNANTYLGRKTTGAIAVTFDVSNSRFVDISQASITNLTVNSTNVTTNLAELNGAILPEWSTSVWDPVFEDYPVLKAFQNTSVWSGYTSYDSSPTLVFSLSGGGFGDPHIRPLFGKPYTLPQKAESYILFDNNNKIDRIQIVGKCWFLPEELYGHVLEKYKRKGFLERYRKLKQIMTKATYFKYVKIMAKNTEIIYDMETLNPVQLTSIKELEENNLPFYDNEEFNPSPKHFAISKKNFSSEGIFGQNYEKIDDKVKEKARERVIKLETKTEKLYVKLARNKLSVTDRNSVSICIVGGDPHKCTGALVRKEIDMEQSGVDFVTGAPLIISYEKIDDF